MRTFWILLLFGSLITYHCLPPVSGEGVPSSDQKPSFDQCKPYVDAALKTGSSPEESSSSSAPPHAHESQNGTESEEQDTGEQASEEQQTGEPGSDEQDTGEEASEEQKDDSENVGDSKEGDEHEKDVASDEDDNETAAGESKEENAKDDTGSEEAENNEGSEETDANNKSEDDNTSVEKEQEGSEEEAEQAEGASDEEKSEEQKEAESAEDDTEGDSAEDSGDKTESDGASTGNLADEAEQPESAEDEKEESEEDKASTEDSSTTEAKADVSEEDATDEKSEEAEASDGEDDGKSEEEAAGEKSEEDDGKSEEQEEKETAGDDEGKSDEKEDDKTEEDQEQEKSDEEKGESEEEAEQQSEEDEEEEEVEPYIPRPREHVTDILGLDDSDTTKTTFTLLDQATQITLKELKRIYENAIKPLETMYKYRDLSNRHFGDPEIFSKPLIVFMGPWSGGKSTIINWLLDIQNEETALRTGADPSPAQFNIMMYGKEDEVLDGTQLAADWTFSGLQKFGQSFLDRLRGRKLPNRLLEKVNIVEIPGILEVRKQVERSFPFNDACQWFIDRADVLFLVYDPAKLDIGPETEAILDQLKGRESQVRIVLNKADTVTPDELLRVQAMLVWNISPLMSSAEPPVMYAASLWDRPLQPDSPKALLTAHENNFLKDIRDGVQKQVETRIASARRFAVRVRNHAKMVDCYLNTYHNHRSFFSDKKKISTDIIDHPQNYHIYEGLSTLTNISRYDLPDPDTYKDFFKLNHLWNFPTLSSTCSFFRGCPINKLDIAIAYELPELLGKFRRQREAILTAQAQKATNNPK